jgi:hypothetical protein
MTESIEKLNYAINKIKTIDYSTESSYELVLKYLVSIKHLPILMLKLPKGSLVYRTLNNNNVDLFYKISDISNPYIEFVKDYGRANKPNQSVFYCSQNRPTSYIELSNYWAKNKKVDDTFSVTIGMWELQRDTNVIMVVNPNKKTRNSNYDKQHGVGFDSAIEKFDNVLKSISPKLSDSA